MAIASAARPAAVLAVLAMVSVLAGCGQGQQQQQPADHRRRR